MTPDPSCHRFCAGKGNRPDGVCGDGYPWGLCGTALVRCQPHGRHHIGLAGDTYCRHCGSEKPPAGGHLQKTVYGQIVGRENFRQFHRGSPGKSAGPPLLPGGAGWVLMDALQPHMPEEHLSGQAPEPFSTGGVGANVFPKRSFHGVKM